jgi:6-phosphogluconolactonase
MKTVLIILLTAMISHFSGAAQWPVYLSTRDGIQRAMFDSETGELGEPEVVAQERARWLGFDRENARLFAVINDPAAEDEVNGGLTCFRITEQGALEQGHVVSTRGRSPAFIDISPLSGAVAVVNFRHDTQLSRGSLIAFMPGPEGNLPEEPLNRFEHPGKGGTDSDRQLASHPHSAVYSPGGGYLAVGDLGIDKILVYREEPSGRLEKFAEVTGPAGQQPRHVVWHPEGRYLYCMNEGYDTVTALEFNPEAETEEDRLKILQQADYGWDRGAGADLKMHPTGKYIYGTVRNFDRLITYAVDPETGLLERIGDVPSGDVNCRSIALSPDGGWLLAAHTGQGDKLVVFRIGQDGLPEPTGREITLPGTSCVLFAE